MRTICIASILSAGSLVLACSSGSPQDGASSSAEDLSLSNARVPVYLNHSYGLFSQATLTALQTNAYVNGTFVDVEIRTTVQPTRTYTGTYLNGRETYVELFPVGTFGYPAGVTGIGLGDEKEGGLEVVSDEWKAALGPTQVDPIGLTAHEINGVSTPWFRELDNEWSNNSTYTGMWVMEYVPNAGSTAPRTRHEERAARYAPEKLVQNVQAFVYGMEAGDAANVRTSLSSVGWRILSWGPSYLALSPKDHGTRRAIVVQPSTPGHLGLLAIVFRLNHETEARTVPLGDAVLDVGGFGPYATLWFVPPADGDDGAATVQAAKAAGDAE